MQSGCSSCGTIFECALAMRTQCPPRSYLFRNPFNKESDLRFAMQKKARQTSESRLIDISEKAADAANEEIMTATAQAMSFHQSTRREQYLSVCLRRMTRMVALPIRLPNAAPIRPIVGTRTSDKTILTRAPANVVVAAPLVSLAHI